MRFTFVHRILSPCLGFFRQVAEKVGDGLHDDAGGLLRPVHMRAEMFEVAGQKVGGTAQQGGFEDGAVFGGEVEGTFQSFAAGDNVHQGQNRRQPGQALRIFVFKISPSLFFRQTTGNDLPGESRREVNQQGGLADGVVCGREDDVGVEKDSSHNSALNFFKMASFSSGSSRSSRFQRSMSESV